MVHFLYPQFRGNSADREHRLIFEESGADKPPAEPIPVETTDEAAPVSAESAEPAAVIEKKGAAVDATQKEVASTPAPDITASEPIIVEGTGGKRLGIVIVEGLPGNAGKTEADFDNAQPKKGEAQTAAADKSTESTVDSAKEAAEPVDAAVTNEQMESVAYQDMGLDGIPKKDVAITLSADRRSGEMFHRDGTSLGTVEFAADGEVSGVTPNAEAIATLKQKTEAKDEADDAAEEKGEKVSDDPEMDRLGKEVDQGVKDLEAAKTPAQALAALGKILSAIIEMVKRTLGIQTEADKQEKSEGKGKEAAADTSTDDGLRKELKDRGATSIEDQREELADLRDQAQEKIEKNKEEISELDTEIDGLQTKKESVDDPDRRRELVDQNKKLEASIAAIDKLESRLDTLESTFDKIEQALQKKFDVTVKIERDDGKTIFNVTTLGEGTPVWFREFAKEHDQDQNPGNGYQIDPTNAELLSKMPESKPLDTTGEEGEGEAETSSEEGGEEPVEEGTEEPSEETGEATEEDSTPTEEPTEEAGEETTEEGTDDTEEPTEEDIGEGAEEGGEEPSEEGAEEPAKESAEEPTEEGTDAPVDEPAEEAGEESTESEDAGDTEAPVEDGEADINAPVDEPEAAPAEDPTASENTPDAAPAEESADAPVDETADAPANEPPETSTEAPADTAADESTDESTGETTDESTDEATNTSEAAPELSNDVLAQRQEWANTINNRAHNLGYPVDISFINEPSSPNHGKMKVTLNTSIQGSKPERYPLLLDQAAERGMRVQTLDTSTAIIDVTQRVEEKGKGFFGPDMTRKQIEEFVPAATDSLSGETV